MKIALITAACFSLVAVPAFASDYVYKANPASDQKVDYEQGVATIYSHVGKTEVDITYLETFVGKREKFLITILNDGPDQNIDISNVTVKYGAQDMHIYSADELAKIINGRAGWAKFAVAMAGAVDEAAATTPMTASTYGNIGGTSYRSNTTIYSTDYYAQAQARNRTDQNLNSLDQSQNDAINNLHATALQLNTIRSGEKYVAKFIVDRPKKIDGSDMNISVTIGEDVHTFDYSVTDK